MVPNSSALASRAARGTSAATKALTTGRRADDVIVQEVKRRDLKEKEVSQLIIELGNLRRLTRQLEDKIRQTTGAAGGTEARCWRK